MFVAMLIVTVSVGCSNLQKGYVEADAKTYRAVANDLVKTYDKIESSIERKLKLNTVKTWGDRLDEALKHEDLAELRANFERVKIPE